MAVSFYSIKDEVRILGFDDGPFRRGDRETLVVGCVFRGGRWMDGVMSTKVAVDGLDSTEKLTSLVKARRFRDVRVVMVDGIAFGGFNVLDIGDLFEETGIPVIAVTRDMPDFEAIKAALKHTAEWQRRWTLIKAAGEPAAVEVRGGKRIHIQAAGIGFDDASSIVRLSATRSKVPEPLRVAHLIARGIVTGQSRGKA
ncbi:MAG: DUF99 family protein [Candidatus Altiarchaeota archaeon]